MATWAQRAWVNGRTRGSDPRETRCATRISDPHWSGGGGSCRPELPQGAGGLTGRVPPSTAAVVARSAAVRTGVHQDEGPRLRPASDAGRCPVIARLGSPRDHHPAHAWSTRGTLPAAPGQLALKMLSAPTSRSRVSAGSITSSSSPKLATLSAFACS